MDREAWRATVHGARKKSRHSLATEQLIDNEKILGFGKAPLFLTSIVKWELKSHVDSIH